MTVGDWAERWLSGQAHVKPSTFARYEGIVRKHIEPKWGKVKLANVSHADVQAWVTALSKERSPATVQKVHNVLSLVLDLAVGEELRVEISTKFRVSKIAAELEAAGLAVARVWTGPSRSCAARSNAPCGCSVCAPWPSSSPATSSSCAGSSPASGGRRTP